MAKQVYEEGEERLSAPAKRAKNNQKSRRGKLQQEGSNMVLLNGRWVIRGTHGGPNPRG